MTSVLDLLAFKDVHNIDKIVSINVHRFAHSNLHVMQTVIAENFPWNIFAVNAIVF